jgi:hypothetical protein
MPKDHIRYCGSVRGTPVEKYIIVSGIPNRLNYYVIFSICTIYKCNRGPRTRGWGGGPRVGDTWSNMIYNLNIRKGKTARTADGEGAEDESF